MIDFGKLEKKRSGADLETEAAYASAVVYLQSTDWQVIAKYERGRQIPDEVAQKRKAALDILTADPVAET